MGCRDSLFLRASIVSWSRCAVVNNAKSNTAIYISLWLDRSTTLSSGHKRSPGRRETNCVGRKTRTGTSMFITCSTLSATTVRTLRFVDRASYGSASMLCTAPLNVSSFSSRAVLCDNKSELCVLGRVVGHCKLQSRHRDGGLRGSSLRKRLHFRLDRRLDNQRCSDWQRVPLRRVRCVFGKAQSCHDFLYVLHRNHRPLLLSVTSFSEVPATLESAHQPRRWLT